MSSMTSSSNVHLSLEATCIYRPYNPYIIMFTRTLVWTHQVIAMINSGIGTDSHFNLVHGTGYTPLGYCITLPDPHSRPYYSWISTGGLTRLVQGIWRHVILLCVQIKWKKKKQYYCIIFVFFWNNLFFFCRSFG